MPRVTCRCGQTVTVPADGPERLVCPKCSAKIRVRRSEAPAAPAEEFIRFACPCGRRLKVRAAGSPQAGQCPDCGRIVPVPTSSSASSSARPSPMMGHNEIRTEELSEADRALLDEWAGKHLARQNETGPQPVVGGGSPSSSAVMKAEAGLRVCPKCGRPVHLNATSCRACGAQVPRKQ